MANGGLRPPVNVPTEANYLALAAEINSKSKLVYAVGNCGGVCVVVLRGDVFRVASLQVEPACEEQRKKERITFPFQILPDPEYRMIHVK